MRRALAHTDEGGRLVVWKARVIAGLAGEPSRQAGQEEMQPPATEERPNDHTKHILSRPGRAVSNTARTASLGRVRPHVES